MRELLLIASVLFVAIPTTAQYDTWGTDYDSWGTLWGGAATTLPDQDAWLTTNNSEIRDTYVRSTGGTGSNFGATNGATIGVNGSPNPIFSYFFWPNLSGSSITGTILSASLSIQATGSAVGSAIFEARPLTEDYVNGNLNAAAGICNWTNRGDNDSVGVGGTAFPTTTAWTTAGGTVGTAVDTVDATGLAGTDSLVFDVTSIVQNMVDGTAYGICIYSQARTGSHYIGIGTLESTAADRPKIYIHWQP